MKNTYLLILLCLAFYSCKKGNIVPDEVTQFSKEALEASINVYPSDTHSFYENYFNKNIDEEYLNRLQNTAIIWRGSEHEVNLREADLVSSHAGVAEYRLTYWVTFKDKREFAYTMHVLNENGTMSLTRFEPMNTDLASTFYAPNSNYKLPNVNASRMKIFLVNILLVISFIGIVVLAIRKKKYLLLLTLPVLFIYQMGITTYHFNGITVNAVDFFYGLPPLFRNLDLHFLSFTLFPSGVVYAWALVGIYFTYIGFRTKKRTLVHQ